MYAEKMARICHSQYKEEVGSRWSSRQVNLIWEIINKKKKKKKKKKREEEKGE